MIRIINKTCHKGCKNNLVSGLTIDWVSKLCYKINFIDSVSGHIKRFKFRVLLHEFEITIWLKKHWDNIFLTLRCDEINYED